MTATPLVDDDDDRRVAIASSPRRRSLCSENAITGKPLRCVVVGQQASGPACSGVDDGDDDDDNMLIQTSTS